MPFFWSPFKIFLVSTKGNTNANSLANLWNNQTQQQAFQALLTKSGHSQIAQLLRNIPPGNISAWLQQQQQSALQQQQKTTSNTTSLNNKTPSAAAVLAHEAVAKAQSNAQKVAAARMQLRRKLEQNLTSIPPPKAPLPDLSFIPSGTHPDFLCMLGLDLTVQRVLKDKNVFKFVFLFIINFNIFF